MSHLCTLTLRDDKELSFQYYFVYNYVNRRIKYITPIPWTAARREVSRLVLSK